MTLVPSKYSTVVPPRIFFPPRLLIKHLPKQMSKLRHDKAELEDRVAELEARLSRQVADMGEMERRNDVYRRELEAAAAAAEELDSPFSLTVPISVRTPADEATGRVRVKIRSAIEQVTNVLCLLKGM